MQTSPQRNLSIYDAPDSDVIILVPLAPTAFEFQVRSFRLATENTYHSFRNASQSTLERVLRAERRAEQTVQRIYVRDEPLMPSALYVGIAGLTGSIIGKNRIFPIRWLLPPLFLAVSASYFLPQTTSNLAKETFDAEKATVPAFAAWQKSTYHEIQHTFQQAQAKLKQVSQTTTDSVKGGLRTVEAKTGVKVADLVTPATVQPGTESTSPLEANRKQI